MGIGGFKIFCLRGSEFFCLLYVCVWGGGGGKGGDQVQYLSFREIITDTSPSNK